MIISNPPYIPDDSWEELPEEVKGYEPHIALKGGGTGGIEVLGKILDMSGHFLYRDGILILEIGETQGDLLLEKANEAGIYKEVWLKKDYAGKPRVLMAKK